MEEKVKLSVLKLLYEKYGMVEEDFQSSELEIVPSFKARDVGIDKSLIGAYGQDDKICAYTSLKALLDIESIPNKTAVCVFMDKEEIGSTGNTGAQSKLLEYFITDICELLSVNVRRCIRNSNMLSADVSGAVDPNYSELHDKKNATYISRGITLIKYTGQKGKLEASDANAEFVGKIRKLFNENNIVWQSGELSKADHGGGGTIAKYAANLGIDVMDCGLPLLSMHSPFEVSGKIDIFMAYKAYGAFFKYIS